MMSLTDPREARGRYLVSSSSKKPAYVTKAMCTTPSTVNKNKRGHPDLLEKARRLEERPSVRVCSKQG